MEKAAADAPDPQPPRCSTYLHAGTKVVSSLMHRDHSWGGIIHGEARRKLVCMAGTTPPLFLAALHPLTPPCLPRPTKASWEVAPSSNASIPRNQPGYRGYTKDEFSSGAAWDASASPYVWFTPQVRSDPTLVLRPQAIVCCMPACTAAHGYRLY